MDRRQAGSARVRAAMQHVEEAQRELGRAMMDLSAVIGYVREGAALEKLYDKVKAEWYRLDSRVGFDERNQSRKPVGFVGALDREPDELDMIPHRGCGNPTWGPR